MAQTNFNDILAFIAVAREGSFTKAAARLGVSQSALSQTVRSLEQRLELPLLVRTTRSVSPTEAGQQIIANIAPHFAEIEIELAWLGERRLKPAGTIRVSAGEHAALTVLQPALNKLLPDYPDIHVEIHSENRLTDIVAERYDAGVRLGDQIDKDMIAVRISADMWWDRPPISTATPRRRRRPTSPATTASTCACPPTAPSTPGSLPGMAAR
jgi:DNA-binding transcriptional LysR family regulator